MHIIYRYTTDIFVRTYIYVCIIFRFSCALLHVRRFYYYYYFILILFGVRVCASFLRRFGSSFPLVFCFSFLFAVARYYTIRAHCTAQHVHFSSKFFEAMLVYGWLVSINLNQLNMESSEEIEMRAMWQGTTDAPHTVHFVLILCSLT